MFVQVSHGADVATPPIAARLLSLHGAVFFQSVPSIITVATCDYLIL